MSGEIETYAVENTLQLFGAELSPMDSNAVRQWLEERVFDLLNHDFNKLVNLLYRIDVYETKAKHCFGKQNKEIARCLADLIWERQWEKAVRRYEGRE
jgi:hypothetical protein